MIVPGSANALLLASAAPTGYNVERSLRFNSSDSAYLSRTPASAGNRKTWTWSGWVKRGTLGSKGWLLTAGYASAPWFVFGFESSSNADKLAVSTSAGVDGSGFNVTNAVFRDPSAWYHILLAFDTTQATATDRIKIYVNNTLQSLATSNPPALNADLQVNNTVAHAVGGYSGEFFNGYLADIHFIDGQALTPSSFTEVSATTGQLIPKAYTGSYGTNGFHLPFSDNSTAAALGTDTSGNSNTWTVNNISVAAGAGNDSLVDTPTSYGTDTGAGGEVRGNYATWNPLDTASATLTNGNLDISTPSSGNGTTRGTFGVSSGKWFYEFTVSSGAASIGFLRTTDSVSGFLGGTSGGYAYYSEGASYTKKINNGIQTDYGASFVAGDVIGVALDLDAGTITFYKNGASQGQAFSGLSGTFAPAISDGTNVAGISGSANFGQRPFAYTAPSGFKALCDTNLPAPVVAQPSTVMDVALWSGDGTSNRSITLPGSFSPDFVWTKMRNAANQHLLYDAVRGATLALATDNTNAETTRSTTITSFNSSGFTTGSSADTNGSGYTYVAWCWDAGSSTVTNTQGSITSQVRANASAGFSIVSYTGTGSNATVGHGLGVAPAFIITKKRSSTSNWATNAPGRANPWDGALLLNATNAFTVSSAVWQDTAPTSTVFSVGTADAVNISSATYVAYCFAPVAGYSNGFSYTGNGSADGSFVYLGFRPRLILLKCSSTTGNWTLLDTAREGYNVDNDPLYPNLTNAEGTTDLLDITSNGFKLRTTDASVNSSGATYVGYAWAEAPFAYARAR